jgi:RNA polymerase sigma-B factor
MDDDEADAGGILEEHIGADDPDFGLAEDHMLAIKALKSLSGEDRLIIVLRFRDELSQSEIADRLGCSQMQVSRRLRKILDELNGRMVVP